MRDLPAGAVEDGSEAAEVLNRLEEMAWVLAGELGLTIWSSRGSNSRRFGVVDGRGRGRGADACRSRPGGRNWPSPARPGFGRAHLGRIARYPPTGDHLSRFVRSRPRSGLSRPAMPTGGPAWDDATLIAQGRASALGGTMLATYAIPSLAGLDDRFAVAGDFLDVGVGVAELAAAFCEVIPGARVVGLDVLPSGRPCTSDHRRAWPGGPRRDPSSTVEELADISRVDRADASAVPTRIDLLSWSQTGFPRR